MGRSDGAPLFFWRAGGFRLRGCLLSRRTCQPPQHEPSHAEVDKPLCHHDIALVILAQPAVSVQPRKCPLHNPALRQT